MNALQHLESRKLLVIEEDLAIFKTKHFSNSAAALILAILSFISIALLFYYFMAGLFVTFISASITYHYLIVTKVVIQKEGITSKRSFLGFEISNQFIELDDISKFFPVKETGRDGEGFFVQIIHSKGESSLANLPDLAIAERITAFIQVLKGRL